MKEIIIGTSNNAKVEQIRGALSAIGDLTVVGVQDKSDFPEIVEDGETAQENARKKAIAYANAFGRPVLSMDNALYFDALEGDDRQPGLNVRRFAGEGNRPTDEEMIIYYSKLIEGLGGETSGRWEFAVCVATPEGNMAETTIISPRTFTSRPSHQLVEGYPLESLQIDPDSGKYISEMTAAEQAGFWRKKIGKPLEDFVKSLTIF